MCLRCIGCVRVNNSNGFHELGSLQALSMTFHMMIIFPVSSSLVSGLRAQYSFRSELRARWLSESCIYGRSFRVSYPTGLLFRGKEIPHPPSSCLLKGHQWRCADLASMFGKAGSNSIHPSESRPHPTDGRRSHHRRDP